MKSIFKLLLVLFFGLNFSQSYAQIGIGTTSPEPSSILDVSSTKKGFLPPRLTKQKRDEILDPAEGLMLYCTDCCDGDIPVLSFFNGTEWKNVPECPSPAPPTIDDIVKKSAKVSLNSDYFVATIGSDGNLYTWGDETPSGQRALGHGVNVASLKRPKPIVNPDNIKFSQVSTGHHGLAIALSDQGYVYGAGLSNKGAGNLNDPNVFTKIRLGATDPKARLIGVSEGGVVCIGQNNKSYIWGYAGGTSSFFGTWNSVKPVERALPTNIESTEVIAIGGSFHYVTIATENKIYFTGTTNYGFNAIASWYTHPATFNKIKSLKVGRDIIIVEDEDGFHSITSTGKTTINTSAITEPINDLLANGNQKTVFAVTDTKIYHKVSPTNMNSATVVNAPAGYKIVGFSPAKILENWALVLLENTVTGDFEYYGFSTTTSGNSSIGNFSKDTMTSLGLNLNSIPNGVNLTW